HLDAMCRRDYCRAQRGVNRIPAFNVTRVLRVNMPDQQQRPTLHAACPALLSTSARADITGRRWMRDAPRSQIGSDIIHVMSVRAESGRVGLPTRAGVGLLAPG